MWRQSIRGICGDFISLGAKLESMKSKPSDKEIAREMANVLVEHLETLPVQERHKKIQAGQEVVKDLFQEESANGGADTVTSKRTAGKAGHAP